MKNPAKNLLRNPRIGVIGILAMIISVICGIFFHTSNLRPLHEQLSERGHLLEQENEPTRSEVNAGREALSKWASTPVIDRYPCAYDIVRGKALIGMDGVEVLYALGEPSRTLKDKYKRLCYTMPSYNHPRSDLYVTFDGEQKARVVYAGLWVNR